MLLETLDIKKDDIVIFSQNIFDLDNNFKIIFKDDLEKKIRKIGFHDVCHFVNEYAPKNIIVYRLMTNLDEFSLHTSKFGFKIYINEQPEIIYFDPVYAIKELEEYPGTVDESLRFRIQQIGLTTLSRVDNVPNFAEIYSIDLRPYEAKYQKDKVFADAIFALNPKYNAVNKRGKADQDKNTSTSKVNKEEILRYAQNDKKEEILRYGQNDKKEAEVKSKNQESSLSSVFKNIRNEAKVQLPVKKGESVIVPLVKELEKEKKEEIVIDPDVNNAEDIKFIKHDIAEDKNFDYKQILKMQFKNSDVGSGSGKEFPKLIKHETGKKNSFGEFLKTNISLAADKKEGNTGGHLTDIFKSPEPLIKLVEERQKEKIVLKLNKK